MKNTINPRNNFRRIVASKARPAVEIADDLNEQITSYEIVQVEKFIRKLSDTLYEVHFIKDKRAKNEIIDTIIDDYTIERLAEACDSVYNLYNKMVDGLL